MALPAPGMTNGEAPPRRRRGRGMPVEELENRYPSLRALTQPPGAAGQGAWTAVFRARPDAMHALLADFIKQVHARPGRIGQRPMPREEEVDFESLVYGEENDVALVDVLPKIMPISARAFAARVHMSRSQFQRLLVGEYEPDVNELRVIAAAVKKPPSYFVEYRKAMVINAMAQMFDERPGIATSLYRHYLEIRMDST